VLVLVVSSVIGLYYYLRVVAALYATGRTDPTRRRISLAEGVVLGALTLVLFWMGAFPAPFLALLSP
jgi:NADH-quinone oxidoreductase subunit N